MKFKNFIEEIFSGKTGIFVKDNFENIKAAVELAEEIGKYVAENKEKTFDELKKEIDEKFVCTVTDEDLEAIDKNKSKGKFKLAYRLAKGFIQADGKEFAEDVFKSAMHLGIQIAVSKFFGK